MADKIILSGRKFKNVPHIPFSTTSLSPNPCNNTTRKTKIKKHTNSRCFLPHHSSFPDVCSGAVHGNLPLDGVSTSTAPRQRPETGRAVCIARAQLCGLHLTHRGGSPGRQRVSQKKERGTIRRKGRKVVPGPAACSPRCSPADHFRLPRQLPGAGIPLQPLSYTHSPGALSTGRIHGSGVGT